MLLSQVDSLAVVNLVCWRYLDPAGQLAHRLGIRPDHAVYGPVGGQTPVRFLHEAALRIAAGESRVAAICGAEAQDTVDKARAAGIPEDRLVYFFGGAYADEPLDYLKREVFFESQAQNAVLASVLELVEGKGSLFETIELYSCFPCVPKMARRALVQEPTVQADADRRRRPVPAFVTEATGQGAVETFTILYDPKGEIRHGVVILRLPGGERTLARVPGKDMGTLSRLMDLDRTSVGISGRILHADDGMAEWKIV